MRRMAVIAMAGLMIGCGAGNHAAQNAPNENDPIAEAPQPEIKAGTYVAAGDLASAQGQFDKAAEQYAKALKASPKDPAVVKKLALAYVKSRQMSKSIETWENYLNLTGGSDDAYGSLGYAYELAGNPIEAERTYEEGVLKNPKGSLTHINYGLMLVRAEKIDQAVKQLSAVLQPHEVNYNIGSVYEQMGRKDLAQFYYRRSLECNQHFTPAKQKLLVVTN